MMLQKDTAFVQRMNKEYPDFIITSWYYRPIDMSSEDFTTRRNELMIARGYKYEGMGVMTNGSRYSFTIPLDESHETIITFHQKGMKSRVVTLPPDDEDMLFAELEAFVKQCCTSTT